MEKIEKYRKLCKIVQYGGMAAFALVGFFLVYWFGLKNPTENSQTITTTILFSTVIIVFMFIIFVGTPMQNRLLKLVILKSLDGLVTEVKFNKKKGYSKESFVKLNLVTENFTQYGNSDFYSFKYKDMLIESTTVRAFDEIKVQRQKGKKIKTVKEVVNYFFGRIYLIPIKLEPKMNIYGKKIASSSRKNFMQDKDYKNEMPQKFKKYLENFEVFYEDTKPDNIQGLLEKLYVLRLQAKGPVSLFVRNEKIVLCIDNGHHYKDIELKGPVDESIVRDYKKDVSMVLNFINSLTKE